MLSFFRDMLKSTVSSLPAALVRFACAQTDFDLNVMELLRYVLSLCASTQDGPSPHRVLSVDVKRAYFYAPAKRPIFKPCRVCRRPLECLRNRETCSGADVAQ